MHLIGEGTITRLNPACQGGWERNGGLRLGWCWEGILSWKSPFKILNGNNMTIIYYTPCLYDLSVSVSKDFHSESRDLRITSHENSHVFGEVLIQEAKTQIPFHRLPKKMCNLVFVHSPTSSALRSSSFPMLRPFWVSLCSSNALTFSASGP